MVKGRRPGSLIIGGKSTIMSKSNSEPMNLITDMSPGGVIAILFYLFHCDVIMILFQVLSFWCDHYLISVSLIVAWSQSYSSWDYIGSVLEASSTQRNIQLNDHFQNNFKSFAKNLNSAKQLMLWKWWILPSTDLSCVHLTDDSRGFPWGDREAQRLNSQPLTDRRIPDAPCFGPSRSPVEPV